MSRYLFDQWLTRRWETETRYYVAEVKQDLFGTWLLDLSWGGLHTRRGNSQSIPAQSYIEALVLMEQTHKRRKQRGYTPIR